MASEKTRFIRAALTKLTFSQIKERIRAYRAHLMTLRGAAPTSILAPHFITSFELSCIMIALCRNELVRRGLLSPREMRRRHVADRIEKDL